MPWPGSNAIPLLAFCMFQLMFAVITPALISGAIADRAKFWGWTVFVAQLGGIFGVSVFNSKNSHVYSLFLSSQNSCIGLKISAYIKSPPMTSIATTTT